ncbi:MAG: FIST N-terminal domain-containing protein [bacterium]|nr:FIST N-terminal domain-containing protein [bacterium]
MKQEIAYTQNTNIKDAITDLCTQLKDPVDSYLLVIFFASTLYDFQALSNELTRIFKNSKVVGVSSGGEITKLGFTKRGLLLTTMSDPTTKISGVIVDDINSFPIIHKPKIQSALNEAAIDPKEPGFERHSFALTFINGLLNLEENFLSMFYAVVGSPDFPLIGASAADDYHFYKTSVSLNGRLSNNGAVILFINTKKKFRFYKQNIYKPTGKTLTVTKSDIQNRTVLEINGKPPLTAYAEELGLSSTTLINTMLDHPLGRTFGNETFITSLAGFNQDKTLNMRTRVFPNSTLDILETDNIISVCKDTCTRITKDFEKPGFVFFIVCICNFIGYDQRDLSKSIGSLYTDTFPTFCGFASNGEQLNQMHMSQTTVALVMEE